MAHSSESLCSMQKNCIDLHLNMLISFSVENFLSIRDLQTLSLDATSDERLETQNVVSSGKFRLLRAAAIYGANASGKSNLLFAFRWMRRIVLSSAIEIQGDSRIPAFPFRLSTKTESAPSYFEVIFLDKDTRFRYGFKADTAKIHAEWLFRRKPGAKRSQAIYSRRIENRSSSGSFSGRDWSNRSYSD